MSESIEATVQRLLRRPWTILRELTPEGDVLLRVKEIPSAVGSGDSDEEREADLWEALAESIRALLYFGDPVPSPDGFSSESTHVASPSELGPTFFFVDSKSASTGVTIALSA